MPAISARRAVRSRTETGGLDGTCHARPQASSRPVSATRIRRRRRCGPRARRVEIGRRDRRRAGDDLSRDRQREHRRSRLAYDDVVDEELRLLLSFVAVAAELNFTRAAKRLHIAQLALSAQIRRLEAQLGLQLLERTTRSVALTAAGEAVFERAADALAVYHDVWEGARRGRGGRPSAPGLQPRHGL